MVYDHRQTGFYTDGVRTIGSVREGRKTLVTIRSGERAQDSKLSNAAQELPREDHESYDPCGLPVNRSG